ncbi:MAG: glycerol-3-phosphate responsive antiterminator [Longicatena sp.]
MIEQKIIPVISDWKNFEKFLKSKQTWCVLIDFHINFMEELFLQLHAHEKKGIVHMDLTKGIQNDQFGTQFMCQKYHVDGIISTKPKAIEAAIKNHCISILRVFMMDTRSLKRNGELAKSLAPDYVEVLPAITPHVVSLLREYCDVNIIGGGLVRSLEDIKACLQQGMKAITTSSIELCEWEEIV